MQNRNQGILFSYLRVAVNMICGMILSVALLRILGDTEYGIYQTIAAFANYLILLEFGMGTVMVRNVSLCRGRCTSKEEINHNISTVWTITCLLSVVIVAISALFYLSIPDIYAKSMSLVQINHAQRIFVFITGYLLFSFLMQTLNGVIHAYEEYSYAAVQGTIRTVVRTVLLLVVLQWKKDAVLIAVIDMAVSAVCFAGSYRYCRKELGVAIRVGVFDKAIVRSSLPLACAIFLQAIVNQANSNVDKFLIGIMLSPESVARYSVGLYIYSIFSSLVNIPLHMYAPEITQKVGNGLAGKALAEQLVSPCRLTALTGGMIVFGFAAVGRQFISVLYGESYLIAWYIAVVLMIPAYLDTVNGVMVNVLDALNKRMARSAALIITTVFNIVLTVFWLNKWGIMGATYATALCTLLGQVLIMNIYYSKAIKLPVIWLFRQTFRGILPYLILGCLLAYGIGLILGDGIVSFLISGIVFVLAGMGGFVFFGMNETEKRLAEGFLQKTGIRK